MKFIQLNRKEPSRTDRGYEKMLIQNISKIPLLGVLEEEKLTPPKSIIILPAETLGVKHEIYAAKASLTVRII